MRALAALAALALFLPVSAVAANAPLPTLDAIALELAGAPVSVWCETDEGAWREVSAAAGLPPNLRGFVPWTSSGPLPVAYISPGVCVTLRQRLLDPQRPVGPSRVGPALLTALHEFVHLRGVRDEGFADCAALALLKTYAIRFFGYKEKVARIRRLTSWRWSTRDGKRVRVKVVRRVWIIVPNPALEELYTAAWQDHRAKPPEYRGACG